MEMRIRSNSKIKQITYYNEHSGSAICSILKLIVFLIGIFNIFLLFLINAWQNVEPPIINYTRTPIRIEEFKTYSDLVNYAADYNGAQIVKAHTSSNKILTYLKSENSPLKVLNDDNSKGNCWGFDGHKGFTQIKISKKIYPQHFTFKHANLAYFDSAPKEICVYSVGEHNLILGCYEFIISKSKSNPEFSQTFPCLSNCEKAAEEFLFEVSSNHGGDSTCVYQVLIHGDPISLYY